MSAARYSCVTAGHTWILSSLPSFPGDKLRSRADKVVISDSSVAAFHSRYDTLRLKGTSSPSVIPPGSGWLPSISTTGRALGEGASLKYAREKLQHYS